MYNLFINILHIYGLSDHARFYAFAQVFMQIESRVFKYLSVSVKPNLFAYCIFIHAYVNMRVLCLFNLITA